MSRSARSICPRAVVFAALVSNFALGWLPTFEEYCTAQDVSSQFLVDLPGGNFSNQMFTSIQRAAGRPNDLFVSRADGNIYRIDLATNTQSTFLTLPDSDVDAGGGYWGLLGFTFAPDFATSGDMYVHVAGDRPESSGPGPEPGVHHRIYVRRYSLENHLSNAPTLGAPTNILRWNQHGTDHSGGWIGFQPGDADTLWITAGDGGNVEGDGRDMLRTGQNPSDFLASVLRVDVSGTGSGEFGNYAIPADNPNATGNSKQYSNWAPEVWSIGLRSPWGGSFDRMTGDFMIGDVGSSQIGGNTGQEEVNFERADSPGGRNYGWRIMEGTTCPASQDPGVTCNPASPDPAFTPPVYDYEYGGGYGTGGAAEFEGRSVTGGYVYRGPIESLQGKYVFADWSSHQTWALEIDRNANGGLGGVVPGSRVNLSAALARATGPGQSPLNGQTAFGEDEAGNLYYMDLGGQVFKICEVGEPNCGPPPPAPRPPIEPVATLRDDFNAANNYQTGNVPIDGIWTGTHNPGFGDTFNAQTTNDGNLTIGLEPVGWQGNGADNGPFLFREVPAENLVEVTVRIQQQSTGNWSSAGILARVAGPLDNNANNDNFLSAHAFRANNNVQVSNVQEGNEAESNFATGSAAGVSHLRLVNLGNGDFEVFSSSDGMDWISRTTVTNEALASGLLEVGVWAGSYAGGTSTGTARFDWAEIVLGVPAGDYNEDATIDAADYVVWRNTMGDTVNPWAGADGNGDGMITSDDYDIWRLNFGKTIPNLTGVSGSLAGVPEPSGLVFVLAAGLTLFAMPWRHWPRSANTRST
jgi:glucose/arabinose dehydrogenase